MRTLTLLVCYFAVSLVIVSAAMADLGLNPATDFSYGVWYDRDSVDAWQQTHWGSVDGGTYNTGGVYDVSIRYHAVNATTASMFATINGISQGFWTGGWKNAQPEVYPAGLSFANDYLDQLQLFQAQWAPEAYGGSALLSNLTVSGISGGAPKVANYTDMVFSWGSPGAGVFTDIWDLTLGDVMLSYTIDMNTVDKYFLVELGLQPATGFVGLNPAGAGWMGNSAVYNAASPGAQGLNDKFDLQNAAGSSEWDYDLVPEPSSLMALMGGLALVGPAVLARGKRRP